MCQRNVRYCFHSDLRTLGPHQPGKGFPKNLKIVLNGSDFHHLQLCDSILSVKELITDGGLLASLEENQRWRKKTLSIDLPPSQLCPLDPARGFKLEQRWCFQIICLPGVGTDIIRSQWTPYQAFHQDIRTHVSESRFAWRGVFPPTCQKRDRRGFLCKQRVCHTRPYPASCSLPLHEISNMGSRHMKAAPRQYCTNSARLRGALWKTLASKS